MAHLRRFDFKTRRYCSTPAVANLRDFTDTFVEDLKRKIAKSSNQSCDVDCSTTKLEERDQDQNQVQNIMVQSPISGRFHSDQTKMMLMRKNAHVISEEAEDDEDEAAEEQEEKIKKQRHRYSTSSYHMELDDDNADNDDNNDVNEQDGADDNDDAACSINASRIIHDDNPSGQQEVAQLKSANWLSESELIFSLSNQVGGLVRALRVFQVSLN